MSKKWYEIKAQASVTNSSGEPVAAHYEISILDEIGIWGVTAKDFINEYKKIPKDSIITLNINSLGGSVFDALAIYNALSRDKSRITSRVEGIAASAASIILMAASEVQMPANAFLMIHNPWSMALGDYSEMQSTADMLKKMQSTLANIYSEKTGQPAEDMAKLMDEETWLDGNEAQALGFIDSVLDEQAIAASLSERDYARFTKAPKALISKEQNKEQPMAAESIAEACEAAGFAMCAAALIGNKATAAQVNARIAEAATIKELARAAGRAEDGEGLIRAGVGVAEARAQLTALRDKDSPNIHNYASTDDSAADDHSEVNTQDRINYQNIYAARRAAAKAV